MTRAHFRREPGDGNGTPAGIRISYQALAILITAIGMMCGAFGFVRAQDIGSIEDKLSAQRREFLDYTLERRADAIQLDHRLERIEDSLDRLNKGVAALQGRAGR